jgi:hypothetical protein
MHSIAAFRLCIQFSRLVVTKSNNTRLPRQSRQSHSADIHFGLGQRHLEKLLGVIAMKINVLMIAVSAFALAGCGPIEDGSIPHNLSSATTSAEISDSPFSQYDFYQAGDEQPIDRPYEVVNGQKLDEPGWCGYGYE